MIAWLCRILGFTLPAPEPRCIITNWGRRSGKPWSIQR